MEEIDETTINNIQTYICGEDAKYKNIYKLFIKEYFKGTYNDENRCKHIIYKLIQHSNEFISRPTGGKKKLKQIFNHKTNKKTRKNKSKKGGRSAQQPTPQLTMTSPSNQLQINSQAYYNIVYLLTTNSLQSNDFSSSFIKIYFLLYDNLIFLWLFY